MEDIILKTDYLTKQYKSLRAVDGVSLTVRRGDIYGFVGLNGSGKTTFIRLVTSLIKPTGGTFSLFGGTSNSQNVKNLCRISSMVETPSIYMNLTAMDNIKVQCDICDIDDAAAPYKLLELVGLDPSSKKTAKNFSLGMRQRLGIAIALVGNPEFLLLDEPTNGLDPEGIIEIRELLKKLNKELNITILISSHILVELDKLATTFGFIHKGKLIKEISSAELHSSCKSHLIVEVDDYPRAFHALEGRHSYEFKDGKLLVDSQLTMSELVDLMKSEGVTVMDAGRASQDLESYFISLIGGKK